MWEFIAEYWLGWVCALLGGGIVAFVKFVVPKIAALWTGVLALLHDRIYSECYKFLELGYITQWCCTIKVDIENSKSQYIEKDKQEGTKDGSESTKI